MKGSFDEAILQEVRDKSDIVSVVSDYVALRKQGQRLVGLCPFHNEKTPSFSVTPDKNLFYCFGCGAGGDVFHFVMQRENMSFPETVALLAERAGVELKTSATTPDEHLKRDIRSVLSMACRFYEALLAAPDGKLARSYLEKRGIDATTADAFRLGYAPDAWERTLRALRKKGYDDELLHKAGLVSRSERGKYYDAFRHRLMFPIADSRGQVIGFGGRTLTGEEPKYINSREGPQFAKGRTWYGMHLARDAIRRQGVAVVMEGYMDVIAAHQFGITNAVASLGTALTSEQARALHVLAPELVIAYDADASGQKAALKGMGIFKRLGGQVRVLVMPEGYDPDDFIRKYGPEEFGTLLEEALPLVEYRYRQLTQEYDMGKVEDKARVAREMAAVLAELDNAVERAAYVERFARDMQVPTSALQQEVRRRSRRAEDKKSELIYTIGHEQKANNGLSPAVLQAEKDLVRLMLDDATHIQRIRSQIAAEAFTSPEWRAIVEILYDWPQSQGRIDEARLMSLLGQSQKEACISLVAMICAEDTIYADSDREQVMVDCITTLKRRRLDELGKLLASDSLTEERRQHFLVEYQTLLKELKSSRA